jgi:hypothetical protein
MVANEAIGLCYLTGPISEVMVWIQFQKRPTTQAGLLQSGKNSFQKTYDRRLAVGYSKPAQGPKKYPEMNHWSVAGSATA